MGNMNTLNFVACYLVFFFFRPTQSKDQQSTCCYDSNIEFVGKKSRAANGLKCKPWKKSPKYTKSLKNFSKSCDNSHHKNNLNYNYCRSIDNTGIPKCVTSRGLKPCAIPKCSETKFDKKGINYKGTMSSGIGTSAGAGSKKTKFTCMRWDGRNRN